MNKLDKFLIQNNYCDLKEINIKKDQEIFFSEPHIIVKGKIDIYIMNIDEYMNKDNHMDKNRDSFKVITLSPEDFIIGVFSHLGKNLIPYNLRFYCKTSTDAIFKKISHEIIDEMLKVPDMSKWLFELTYKKTELFTYHLFMRNMVKGDDLIEFLLKKEAGPLNVVEIDNVFDFIDKYNISRSTFYNGIKNLEEAKKIKKEGKKIIIL